MYYVRRLNGVFYVIHKETGLSLPYFKNKSKMEKAYIDYKKPHFDYWFRMGGAMRKQIKERAYTNMINTTEVFQSMSKLQEWDIHEAKTAYCKQAAFNSMCYPPLVTFPPMPIEAETPKVMAKTTKDKTMYNDCDDCCSNNDPAIRAQNYLENRLSGVIMTKEQTLRKDFGLVDDERPQTPKDLIERITSGKFTVPSDKMENADYEPIRRFRWRDPSVKEDHAGYKTACGLMQDASTEVLDAIHIQTKEEALKAIKEYETKTFH